MKENKIVSEELWTMLDEHLSVTLPRYRINEYLAFLSKTLLSEYKADNFPTVAKLLLGLSKVHGDAITFNFNDLMTLDTKTFNALVMLIICCKKHHKNTEHYFGQEFIEVIRALYIAP